MNKKIAVISDIHSNFTTLKICLEDIEKENIDMCIILGDLLTYGTMPNEVICLLLEFQKKMNFIFIKGNHDQFYFDIYYNIDPIKYKMADFVKETIFWTEKKLKFNLLECFEWKEYFIFKNIYFSHANPFNYGNWEYLNNENSIRNATLKLKEKGMSIGIFGHTHRSDRIIISDNSLYSLNFEQNTFKFNKNDEVLILNPGSIGQPRGVKPQFLILTVYEDKIDFYHKIVNVNPIKIIDEINSTTLSEETKNKLKSFWENIYD